jgi:hypothetical protein
MVDYRNKLHAITRKNVIDYNWLWLQITITPCLSAAVFHYIKKKCIFTYTDYSHRYIFGGHWKSNIYNLHKWKMTVLYIRQVVRIENEVSTFVVRLYCTF